MPSPKSPTTPIYQWHEGVEELESYCPGGYHPTHIGDHYHETRYEVLHKLGHGTYSTVWLARDHLTARNVALKILVADTSHDYTEGKILRALGKGKADHPGRNYVPSLLDEFVIEGPNGHHLCVVSEAAGCCLAQSKEASVTWKFSADVARAISARLLLGLDYIHSCGVVHGGEPQKLPVERLEKGPNGPEVPKYCVPPAMIFQSSEEIVDARVIISDFGESFLQNETRKKLHTPILLLPPEIFFHESLDQAIDVWTLGCTLYEVLGERPLFEGFMPDNDHVIAEIISTLEPLPKRWWDQWELRQDFFHEDGSWNADTHRRHAAYSRPLTERLRIMGRGEDPSTCEFGPKEMDSLKGLLQAMLTYEPSERITTSNALESEWMKEWGRPAMIKTGLGPKTPRGN